MIAFLLVLTLFIPAVGAAQVAKYVDEIRVLAREGSDSGLVVRVRQRPDEAYRALQRFLAGAVSGTESVQASSLGAAHRIASAYATVWRDSSLVRWVVRFQSLSTTERRARHTADSIRGAGDDAMKTAGIESAMAKWRESLRRFEALGDSGGIVSSLGSIGWGFFLAQELDSAEVYLTRCLNMAERIGNRFTTSQATAELGSVSDARGDLKRASELYNRAGELMKRIGDMRGLARVHNSLGILAARQGDLAVARREFESAVAGLRAGGYLEEAPKGLLNLAHLAKIEGDYAEAAAHLGDALAIFRSQTNEMYVAATLKDLGALLADRGDYAGAATALSEAAGILRRIGSGPQMNEIDVRVLLAHVRANTGDLQGARAEVARAETLATRLKVPASLGLLALERGNLALDFNQLAEAERQYTKAERLTSDEELRQAAQYGTAVVHLRRENYRRAQDALERLLQGSLTQQHAAVTRLTIAQAAWRRGDTATARRSVDQALDTMRALGAVTGEAEALRVFGELEAAAGHPVAAESLYRHALERLGARPPPGVAWQLHAALATSLRRRGALVDASREFLAGIEQIESVSATLQLEEHRSSFHADKWEVYSDLALVEYGRGRIEASFEVSERLRGRQMLDLLARGRIAQREPIRELAVREQDLRRRVGELARQDADLQSGQAEAQRLRDPSAGGGESSKSSQELARLREDYGKLLLEMRRADPTYAAFLKGEAVRAGAVRMALAPDEALLEYLVGDSTTLVFVVTSDTVAALDLKVEHEGLAAQVDFARSTLASAKEAAARRAWRAPLRRLYRRLVAPVEASGLLAGKRRLVIAPHAELHYLPFSALVRPGPPEQVLIDQYLIEYVPSASVWIRLRDRSRPTPGDGILALAPRATALPGSRSEVAAIRRIYGDRAQTLVGRPATESAFRARAPGQEIVHLATYGVLNKHNPLFSYVEMGAGDKDDGRLEVHEVFGLDLNARLLVLSACQTGLAAGALGDVPPGDDWVGLVQGFLYAGASNVMATLWPVADVATARLMQRFYQELAAGRSETEALALAQRAALRDSDTAHPFFWAGFTLVRGR